MNHSGVYLLVLVLAIIVILFMLNRYSTRHPTPADDEVSKAQRGMLPKIVILGMYSTAEELYGALLTNEFAVSDHTRSVLMRTTITPPGTRMRPVITTPEELGFPTGDDDPIPSPIEIIQHAQACGLTKLSAGDAAELRLQWPNQLCDHEPDMDGRNLILVGMDPVLVGEEPMILALAHAARRLWLLAASAEVSPDSTSTRWYLRRWLFGQPEKADIA